MLKLKLQYFGHLMRRVDSLEKTLMLGGIGGRRRRRRQKITCLDGITDFDGRESEWTPGVGDGQGGLACCDSWGLEKSDTTEQLNWTDGLPRWLSGKDPPDSAGDAGDLGSILGLGRSPGVGNGNPLQYSCLENSVDREACRATVQGVAKNQTRLSIQHIYIY